MSRSKPAAAFILALLSAPISAQLAPEIVELWRSNWHDISQTLVKKFKARIRDAHMQDLPPAVQVKIMHEVDVILADELSWEKNGDEFVRLALESCSESSRQEIIAQKQGKRKPHGSIADANPDTLGCVLAGGLKGGHLINEGFERSLPRINAMLQKLAAELQ